MASEKRNKQFGIVNVDKPAEMTSRQVVDHVLRLVKPAKAGHAGTLDPMARGVLVVCIGSATRLIPYVQQQRKVYRARFQLGRRSATDDITGDVEEDPAAPVVRREDVERRLPAFLGCIEQVPPQYSAVKVQGQRAYRMARKGEMAALSPKVVEIDRLELTEFQYPEMELEIVCGSGTYVRSIGRDLGEKLGCGAVMSDLIRSRIGPYDLETAVPLSELNDETLPEHLLPARTAVAHLSQYQCGPEQLRAIQHGRPIHCSERPDLAGRQVAVLSPGGELACLAEYRRRQQSLAPKQVFIG